mmetsp:Transcript_17269/g.47836  ORF Transcript_17269/g.47836 Transcript_17269/m.47836 type:complete len:254 (-) Transcript_17269:233-994(-)|eukprot:CAMPEP_0198131850 /NCGR_PEP_ID=MMETSP1442-20131203/57077_1 /TAXON_ID= /ORGANISM="Craspedostauros australis, Strain CCMP3328" /LENGTH=253 /DNA_ID=CAMNT_0043792733 /DNA_START=54 /DNA_END=815 /DNA_ORIENTATION=+
MKTVAPMFRCLLLVSISASLLSTSSAWSTPQQHQQRHAARFIQHDVTTKAIENSSDNDSGGTAHSRRMWMRSIATGALGVATSLATTTSPDANNPRRRGGFVKSASAAPPIAVIAEELGYFPVQNKDGQVQYIPKKIARASTDQAVQLAKTMQQQGVTMYGAYWCPHCARQREVFGKEAWSYINYVECSPKGFGFQGMCSNVDGYPTWKRKTGRDIISGETSLEALAKAVGFAGFDPALEDPVPLVGSTCKIR